jgi:hypothetical protein
LANQNLAEARQNQEALSRLESQMAKGDLYRWVINSTLDLQERHDVRIVSYEKPQLGPVDVPPAVPYSAASWAISGSAYFEEFGSFLADFENSLPFSRLKALSLWAASPGLSTGGEPERLAFRIDCVGLARTDVMTP